MLIGKTYWKALTLANFLCGQEVIIFNKTDLQKLQEIENKGFRHILQVPTYAAIRPLDS